jgi:hypothetical protein
MRITKIGVMVAKIWQNKFQGSICNYWKVARAISEKNSISMRAFLEFCGLQDDCGQNRSSSAKQELLCKYGSPWSSLEHGLAASPGNGGLP